MGLKRGEVVMEPGKNKIKTQVGLGKGALNELQRHVSFRKLRMKTLPIMTGNSRPEHQGTQ